MPPPSIPPTRRSTECKDWVLVGNEFETGAYTAGRPPQRNDDNMSPPQAANASTDGSSSYDMTLSEEHIDVYHPSAATVPKRPVSNSESSSTETAGTDNTLTGVNNQVTTPAGLVPTPYTHSEPAYPLLTQNNMDLHQRLLNPQYPGNVTGWIDGAGMGDRFIRSPPSSVAHSMLTAVSSMSGTRGSGSSVAAGLDWLLVPQPVPADDEVVAAGTWSDKAMESFIRRFSVLSVDDE